LMIARKASFTLSVSSLQTYKSNRASPSED
jgi:hypothetical protein